MQDVELFLSLAEIAGVFVGFGALIALRSSGPGDTYDVMMIGMVVLDAIAVVIIALAPVAVSRFGVTGHALWLTCSVIALLVFFAGDEVVARVSRERRAFIAAAPMRRRWKGELAVGVVTWLPAIVALGLVILGVIPEQDAALYFLAAALILLLPRDPPSHDRLRRPIVGVGGATRRGTAGCTRRQRRRPPAGGGPCLGPATRPRRADGSWDMQDADLFLGLAGIAGVFVGFGALIAVRSGGPSEPLEVAPMRGMVSMGMLTVVAALVRG